MAVPLQTSRRREHGESELLYILFLLPPFLILISTRLYRWLLKKAVRSHEVSLLIVTCDGRDVPLGERTRQPPATEPVVSTPESIVVAAEVHKSALPQLRLSGKRLHVKVYYCHCMKNIIILLHTKINNTFYTCYAGTEQDTIEDWAAE